MQNCTADMSYLASPELLSQVFQAISFLESFFPFAFGAYCIIYKTPGNLKQVKNLLLNLHIWCMLSDFMICCLGRPYAYLPSFAGFGLGLIDAPGILFYIGCCCIAAHGVSIMAIYENRYFILFAQTSSWKKYRKLFLPIVAIAVPVCLLPSYLNIPEQESARAEVFQEHPCLKLVETGGRQLFVFTTNSLTSLLTTVPCSFLIAAILAFFVLTCYKTWKRTSTSYLSKTTMKIQKSFLKAITAQFLFLGTMMFMPLFVTLCLSFSNYHNQIINNLMALTFSTFGVGSTIIMILVYKPYREYVFELISCNRSKSASAVQQDRISHVVSTER
ncbi:hypothetical protein B9Z55_017304 [Caenorhabditis nigoni]|nr:hypothetical protein B9Z55_017304 [Caenorhabditis nigoni]